jgi:excisionase family DNA binding protein
MTTTLEALDGVPPESIPAAIAHLSARLLQAPRPESTGADEQLSVDDAARLLHVSRRFVWTHARELGATRVSARKIVLSRRRLTRWLEARR